MAKTVCNYVFSGFIKNTKEDNIIIIIIIDTRVIPT